MSNCVKCGREDDGWLMASVDLNALLCINCSDRFNEWCETHPLEPYSNFIQPKPWNPMAPGLIMFEVDGKMHAHMPMYLSGFGVYDAYEEMGKFIEQDIADTRSLFDPPYAEIYLDMTDDTAELSSPMAQLLWIAQNQG